MTYRVKELVLDSQEARYHGTFNTDEEAKLCFARVLDNAFDGLDLEFSVVRQTIEAALRKGYLHFRENGKVTRWFMIERD